MDSNCIICGKELPMTMTQLLIGLEGEYMACCMQHEGSGELKEKVKILLSVKQSKSECSKCPKKASCYGIEVISNDCKYYSKELKGVEFNER